MASGTDSVLISFLGAGTLLRSDPGIPDALSP